MLKLVNTMSAQRIACNRMIQTGGLRVALSTAANTKPDTSNAAADVARQSVSDPTSDNNQVPTTLRRLNSFEKYLVYRYSSQKYASTSEVPDAVSLNQLVFAKDKARASMSIVLIGFCVLGAIVSIMIGKHQQKKGIFFTDDLTRQHAQYSKAYSDIAKASKL